MAVVMAGFVDFEITWRADVFNGAPQASSAASFGTLGINFHARKPRDEAELATALAALNCEVPSTSGDEAPVAIKPSSILDADAFYDAGDLGCSYGPLQEIAVLMAHLSPGQTLEVRATDLSVRVDLPVWCRLTGHELISSQADRYLIKKI